MKRISFALAFAVLLLAATVWVGQVPARGDGTEEDDRGALEARVARLEAALAAERERLDALEGVLDGLLARDRGQVDLARLQDVVQAAVGGLHERLAASEERSARQSGRLAGQLASVEEIVREVHGHILSARRRDEPTATPDPPAASKRDSQALEKDLKLWTERLASPDENIRFSATLELGRLKDGRAVPALLSILAADRDFYVRLGAAAALGDIRDPDAVPGLIEALDDGEELVCTAAKDALHAITKHVVSVVVDTDAPPTPSAIIQEWKAWWKNHEAEIRSWNER